MDNTQAFAVRPKHIEIVFTAQAEWARFVAAKPDSLQAMRDVIDAHVAHVNEMIAAGELEYECGALIITDVQGYDLSMVDAHFPSIGERVVQMFTRRGVEVILQIMEDRNIQHVIDISPETNNATHDIGGV